MTASVQQIVMRSKAAWADRDLWKSTLEEAYMYALPDRNPYTGNAKNPQSRSHLYDSTAMQATFRGANRMLLDLTPPDQNWIDLKPGHLFPEDQKDAATKLLAVVSRTIMTSLNSGAFISAIYEYYLDLIVAGMGAMLVLENQHDDLNPVTYKTVSQADVAIELGPNSDVVGVYRTPKEKAREIMIIWSDAKNIPHDLQEKIDDKKKDHDIELIEATYFDYDNKKEPWKYQVMYKSGKGKDPVTIVDRNYSTNPWITTRWSKIPGSTYGPGPVMLAMSDIKTVNQVVKMMLMNAALSVSGVYTAADDGVLNFNNIAIRPGAVIPVKRNGGSSGPSLSSLPVGRGFDVGQFIMDDLRTNIRKTMMDNGLPPENAGVRSATEIVERMREIAQDLGGAFGRLMNELIVPLVRRVIDIFFKRGLIPVDLKIDQFTVKVQVNSPMARTQQIQDVQKVVQWMELSSSLAGQEGAMIVGNIEEILPWIATQLGVPPELLREKAEVKQLFSQLLQGAANQNNPVQALPQGVLPQQEAA